MSRSDFSKVSDAMESYFAKGQLERKRIKYKSRLFCDFFILMDDMLVKVLPMLKSLSKLQKATETALSSYEHRNEFSVLKKPK